MQDPNFPFELTSAKRTTERFTKSRPSSTAAQKGLAYERKVFKQLNQLFVENYFSFIEHNPWFEYEDFYGHHICSPDFILHQKDQLIIVEVKLTWVPEARGKLESLYQPVIEKALGTKTTSLIICKIMAPNAGSPQSQFSKALNSPNKLLHWPAIGRIEW